MIEEQVLNYIIKNNDYSFITENGITEDYFPLYKQEFNFIKDHFDKYQRTPDVETFFSKFYDPTGSLGYVTNIVVNEPKEYLLDELYKEHTGYVVSHALKSIVDTYNSGDYEKALVDFQNVDLSGTKRRLTAKSIFDADSRYKSYVDRCNDLGGSFVKTGFKELDNALGGWDRHEELATVVARTNMGKCLAKGTEILMADGTLKKVENVQVGDKVQSLRRINTVLALHNGKAKGYKIKSDSGTEFVVSENHILTLMDKNHCITDITIEKYLKSRNRKKKNLRLYVPPVHYRTRELLIDPYTVGNSILSCPEIPIEYITSDFNQRLSLLAGIIDSCGNGYDRYFRVKLNDLNTIKIVAQLARGLGIKVSKIYDAHSDVSGESIYVLYIYADSRKIPTKVKVTHKAKSYNYVTYNFSVEEVGEIEYYGFMCDGDSRYMLWDNTLTHNTWILLKTALAAANAGLNVGLYSGEMGIDKIGYRIDTLQTHISNSAITRGHENVMTMYKKAIESYSGIKGDIKVIEPKDIGGRPATVTDLRKFVENYNLDMLCIDQHSLLEDERHAKNPVERAANISRDLKNLQVTKKIPIISVCQQNRESTEESGVTTAHIAQSDRIGQDSTVILAFEKNKDDTHTLQILKARDSAIGLKFKYKIDFDKGIFDYIPEEGDGTDGNSEESEELRSFQTNGDDFF